MVKLKAFTLFDSLVAVSITAIIIAIISFSYGKLLESDPPMPFYKAKEKINELFHNLKESKTYFTKTFTYDTYTVIQNVSPYKGRKDIFKIEYDILINHNKIHSEKRLLINEE